MENVKICLPDSKRGRKSKEEKILYKTQLKQFAENLKVLSLQTKESMIKAGVIESYEDWKASARGWCYLLEVNNTIDKSQFDQCERIINKCRKNGLLPIDFTAYYKERAFENVEPLKEKYQHPEEYIQKYLEWAMECEEDKDDVAFCESQEYYIQMMVEKIDIFNLFMKLCEKYHIPIANAKGWSDINSRNELVQRFKEAEEIGLKPVLLYYGDFDPTGILIVDTIKKNLKDIQKATSWNPDNLIVDKFGLTFEFIEENHLTWIDNLITGSGKKASEKTQYVKDYVEKYGRRKCEANAILPIGHIAVRHCEDTILKYLTEGCFENYDEKIEERREEVKEIMDAVNLKERIQDLIDDIDTWKNKNHDLN